MQEKLDKAHDWNVLIKQYVAQHKYLGDVGKLWILKGGATNEDLQEKLKEALVHADKSLFQLKTFFSPVLGTANLFKEDELKSEVQRLAQENCALINENHNLKQTLKNLHQNNDEESMNEKFQILLKHKQEQFNDTLKVQNDLIDQLKQQLDQNKKDVEMFRALNTNLEMELKKKTAEPFDEKLFTEKFPEFNHSLK